MSVEDISPEQARNLVADALESGKYQQGELRLEQLDGDGNALYCCLGVACKVYLDCGGTLESEIVKLSYIQYREYKEYNNSYVRTLPPSVRRWLGFITNGGSVSSGGIEYKKERYTSLWSANDYGMPFKEIAKVFRNPPKGLLS